MIAAEITVRAELYQELNRFWRTHPMAPTSNRGGARRSLGVACGTVATVNPL